MPDRRVIFSVLAHPDDESFGEAGTYARYAREGVDVHICIATDGAAGTTVDDSFGDDLATVRAGELARAIDTLGVTLHTLDYRDSGYIDDDENNNHPDAFINADPDEVVARIVDAIRRLEPDVVITHDETGGYYHPDHIRCCEVTTRAFHLAGDPDYRPGGAHPPHQPKRLYYNAFSKRRLSVMILMMRLKGQDPKRYGRSEDIDLTRLGIPYPRLHARIDYRKYWDIARDAAACHASQGGNDDGLERYVPMAIRRRFMAKDMFIRAYPVVPDGYREYDLFEE